MNTPQSQKAAHLPAISMSSARMLPEPLHDQLFLYPSHLSDPMVSPEKLSIEQF